MTKGGGVDPPRVFVSYSHRNHRWKQRFLGALAPLASSGTIEVWHDDHIEHGDDWFERIAVEIQRSRFVVLLLTPDFLASDFIRATELPYIEALRARTDLTIYPWICEPCGWHDVSLFAQDGGRIQCHPADGNALSQHPEPTIDAMLAGWAGTLADRADVLLGRPRLEMQREEARNALRRGRTSLAAGDFPSARASFEEAERLWPDLADAHYYHALALLAGRRAKKVNRQTMEGVERHLEAAIRSRGEFLDHFLLSVLKWDYYQENGFRMPPPTADELLGGAVSVRETFDPELFDETFQHIPWIDNPVTRWLAQEN